MKHLSSLGSLVALFITQIACAQEVLVRFSTSSVEEQKAYFAQYGGTFELVSTEGQLYKWTTHSPIQRTWDPRILYVQPNRPIKLFLNPSLEENRDELMEAIEESDRKEPEFTDNPEIKLPGVATPGVDTLLNEAWGIFKISADKAWSSLPQGMDIVVAVTDTGVDYNHVDLIANIWRNTKEVAGDNIDNDGNGFIDDVVGWDFASNDNKPYDYSLSIMQILLEGGNPGHGTHVAGVVGAGLKNGMGVAGVAPRVKIMPVRFLTEKGEGTTEGAIKSIDYAVQNGARIINASWGGEAGAEDDAALKEAIARAEKKGIIFVAAAGNGRLNAQTQTVSGYDNDSDAKPAVPASFDHANIMAVAALDSSDTLASFSNWGKKTVDVGAPGVKILSTVPGDRYQHTIIELGGMTVTWDGTSMAAPFVAGALAAIWSKSPGKTWNEVYDTLLSNTEGVSSVADKVKTGGRLDLAGL